MFRSVFLTAILILCSSAALAGEKKSQEPQRPFPYDEVEVTYESADGAVQLAGTLTLPRSEGPFPTVYLIPGGTPFDRDQDMMGHKTFLVLSDHLTRHGFAVLRMDDRGIGGSTGKKMTSSLDDITNDVIQGLEYLAAREDIDADRIGVVGHSAGGMIAPSVASRHPGVSFVVMLAGTGQPFLEVIALQYVEDGVGTEAMNLELAGLAVAILEEDPEAGFDEIAEAWKARAADMTPGDSAQVDALTRETRPGLGMFLSQPFLRDLLIFDAGAALKASSCPVLALGGEFDPMKVTLPSIRAALESRSESNYRVELLPEINHMFQTAPDMGSPPEWAALEETFSPSALELLTNWVQEYTQGP